MTAKKQGDLKKPILALPRLEELIAEKTRSPQFAKLYEDDLAALRLGVALCEARERLNLTQQDIENRTGVSQETLSRIERGRMPSLTTLQKLAKALEVQVVVRPDDTLVVEPFASRLAA